MDSIILGTGTLNDVEHSDSFDITDSVLVESNRLVTPSVRLAYVVESGGVGIVD